MPESVVEESEEWGIPARYSGFMAIKEYREKFDFVVSRAVANLATLTELSLPFVKKNGYFIPYKSALVDEEILKATHAIRVTGGKYEKVQKFTLPGYSDERNFVFIKVYRQYTHLANIANLEHV